MNIRIVVLFLVLIVLYGLPSNGVAGTFTAATCNRTDVNAVINGPTHTAVDGDVIIIPAGTCTWTMSMAAGIVVPDGIAITIMGAGTPDNSSSTFVPSSSCYTQTTINMAGLYAGFVASPHYGASTMRISCMTLHANSESMAVYIPVLCSSVASDCPDVRIDNIHWTGWGSVAHYQNSYGIMAIGDAFGVIDHNDVDNTTGNGAYLHLVEVNHGSFLGVGSNGDNSWAAPDYYGTERFLFFENNTFRDAGTSENEGLGGVGGPGGMRSVVRFNVFENPASSQFAAGWHEMRGRNRGGREVEFYRNTWNCNTGAQCGTSVALRGGTVLQWGNTYYIGPTSSMPTLIDSGTARFFGALSGIGACDGSQPWDTNDGVTYYSGTVASLSDRTVTVNGSPGWTTDQWRVVGSPYSLRDVTQNTGTEIWGNASNTLTLAPLSGFPGGTWFPNPGDTIQILRATRCFDAGASGAGLLYTGTDGSNNPTPAQSANQAISPIRSWLNAFTGQTNCRGGDCYVQTNSFRLTHGRDIFKENLNQPAQSNSTTPFDGVSTPDGVTIPAIGHGFRTNRPSNCATGVAYWATDQGSWNTSGSGGQGVLDLCTATNTWTNAYYVPYDYPHPLISGNAPAATVSQSGYRWRNDNGSETTATWKAAQNTSTSVDKNTAIRLRTQLNGTVDPASAAYRLEYKLSTDSTYKVVPLPASQQVTTITTTGSGTFTGPVDTTTAQVQCWGAGAAGGRAIEDNKSGAGGGGGGYAVRTAIGLTEGTSYSYSVGAGGTDGTSPAGGGDTTFTGNSSVQCIGKGATSLTYNGTTTNQTGGAGGTGSTGDTTRTGGAGGAGANTSVAGWTKVQFASNTACTASSTTCAVTVSSTGTGHVLVAGIITNGTATAITISSVSGAGTWTLCTSSGCAINGGASFANLDLAYNLNSTSGVTSVTVTRNTTASSTGWKAFVAEYSFSSGSVAIDAVGVVDRTASNASTKAGVTLSLSGSNDLCVQMIEANKNVSSVDSGFAIRTTTPVGYAFADAVAKTSCAETWTLASAGKSVHSALAIKLTGGGGTIFSGGGGEGACTTGTGNAGTTGATTGAGGTGCDGGDGGNGVAAGTAGANGTAPGGGGSGGYRDTSTSRDAGAGANGQLKITYTPSPRLDVALSSNIAASCATVTTAQLNAPTSKTTSDFTAGKICDDSQSATVDIASEQYTELEWSLIFTSAATYDQVYQFRVTNAGTPLDAYDVTPSIVVHTPPVPALSSISPTSGDVGATVAVTIHGADLDSGNATISVSGTGVTVSSPILVNATTMTANFVISGGAGLGSRNVTVTTDTGTTNAVTFTITNTPTLTAISPATAVRNGTQSVTLTGTGLNVGSAAINVSGTGITVTNLAVQSGTQITADFVIDGTAAIGNRTVTVTTVGGTSGSQTFAVTSGLALSGVTPSNAIRGSTLDVVLTGSSLNSGYMGGDALVAFSPSTGITINSTTVNSDSQITVNITIDAAAAATARTVTATTDDGSTNGLSFTVTAPSTPGAFSAARMRTR